MVSSTVTKRTKTNQNITIVSKKHDWVDSFHFWPKSQHRFVSDPNRCIECNPIMVSVTVTKPTKMNQNITIGSKKHYWLRSFHFWPESVHRFVFGPNRCIECDPSMVFSTVTKRTKTNQNITIVSKNMIGWIRFISGPNRSIVSFLTRIDALNVTLAWFLSQ